MFVCLPVSVCVLVCLIAWVRAGPFVTMFVCLPVCLCVFCAFVCLRVRVIAWLALCS